MHSSFELAKLAPFLRGQACRVGMIANPLVRIFLAMGFADAQPTLQNGLSGDGIRRLVWAIAVGMLFLSAMPLSAHPAELTDKDTIRLTELVRQDCGSCHGLTLKGGLGRPLLPKHLEHYEVSVLADLILYGIPQTAMPGWDRLLDRHEAEWIAGALKEGKIAR